MKQNRKWLLTALAAAMLLPSLAACGDSGETVQTTADTAETAEEPIETTELEARAAISDELPERDYGGANFISLCGEGNVDDLIVEELDGEIVNDATYNMNLRVEERFNVKIGAHAVEGDVRNTTAYIEKCVQSGITDDYQLINFHVVANSGNVVKGLYLNWYDIPYVDFDKPWWADSTVEDLTLNGKTFLAIGDYAMSSISATYCMIYDKEKAVEYGIPSMYDVVTAGEWTMDYLTELSETVYTDLNGNGVSDPTEDYYALGTDYYSNMVTYTWAGNNPIYRKNAAGELEYVYYTEHLVDLYDKLYHLIWETPGIVATEKTHGCGLTYFQDYRCLFMAGSIGNAKVLADFEHEYGIIPYPKYDTAQEEYITMADGGHQALSLPITTPDLEYVGILTEALCAETYKTVLPAFYDVCLKQRYSSSEEDAEMIDLCVASRMFDFGYVYDNWQGVAFLFQDQIVAKKNEIASYYQTKERAALKYYETVVEKFME
ncbi:MAG: hypothetical protein IJ480_04565 [Clostridia bacterium]|nr:hypothetical protein [Clostridia bacterium]